MKKLLSIFSIMLLASTVFLGSCKKSDSAAPTIDPYGIEDYDFIQLTNDNASLPVRIAGGDDRSIDSITVNVYKFGSTTLVTHNILRTVTSNNLPSFTISIPFPLPTAGAPSGVYTIEYTIYDRAGKKTTKSYNVNISNLQTAVVTPCVFPSLPLPAGKNVWFMVTCPANTPADADLYVSGDFESWSGGGNPSYKFTKVSQTCFYIALNLTGSNQFKVTRGSWGTVMKGANGEELNNLTWNGQSVQTYTVPNWVDRIVLPPTTIPTAAIATGNMTVVADVNDTDPNQSYYLVKQGATSLTGAVPMIRISTGGNATSKLAAKVPKDATAKYVVAKNTADNTGINAYGYEQVAVWDGKTNPVYLNVDRYKPQGQIIAPFPDLFIVGGATPGGWNNPVPVPQQKFTSTGAGKYSLTLALTNSNGGYLLLPSNGDWSYKWGMKGDALSGNVVWQGPDFSPPANGNYKIEVDFYRGTYTLTKQ